MPDLSVVDVPPRLKEGIELVEKGLLERAKVLFEDYFKIYPESPIAMSYVGMLTACEEGRGARGLALCQEAAQKDPEEPLCYLNLSKAYLACGDRFLCVRALHRGLRLRSPHRELLVSFYKTIGMRRKPPIPVLSRDNPLNRILGRLTWRLRSGGVSLPR